MNTCDGGVHIFAAISANDSPYCLTGSVRVPYLGRWSKFVSLAASGSDLQDNIVIHCPSLAYSAMLLGMDFKYMSFLGAAWFVAVSLLVGVVS